MPRTDASRSQLINELERQRDLLRRQQAQDELVLATLYKISLACRERPSLHAIFAVIYQELRSVFTFDSCYIAVCDETPEQFKAALLIDEEHTEFIEAVEYGYLTGKVVHERAANLYSDLLVERDAGTPPVMFGNVEKRSRSWLGVPLMVGGDAVGVISLQSYRPSSFSSDDRDLLQSMANVIAVGLENINLSERQRQLSHALSTQVDDRTEELAALSAIAGTLVVRQPLDALLDSAIAVTLELFNLDAGNVRLLDESGETLVLAAARGFGPEYMDVTARSPLERSPIRDVVLENRAQIIPRDWRNLYNSARFPLQVFPAFECAISVPLSIGSSVLGTLTLFGYNPHDFNEHEISLAQAVANQIAVVIENSRLLDMRERQIAELRALGSVSHAASTAYTLRDLLWQVHNALQSFMPIDAFSMVIYNPERGVISEGISIDEGETYAYWDNQPPPPHSLTAYVLRTQQILRFTDLPSQIGSYPGLASLTIGADRPARSWIGTPLLDRSGRSIGAINVQSYRPAMFSERDEEFMRSVAGQVALHVQNVSLLLQRERQIAELEAIGQIGKLVSASYDLNLMLEAIYRVLVDLSAASVFYLLIWETESQLITNAVFVEEGAHVPLDLIGRRVRQGTISDWILQNRRPLLFGDLVEQRREMSDLGIMPQPVGPENPVRSLVGVPLVARDGELIGVLSLQAYQPFRYDSGTVDFLEQVASHISLGVQKVRLFEERERQAAENARLAAEANAHAEAAERQAQRIELVHRITSVLTARLNQQEILELASRELVQLFWADHSGTVLFHSAVQGVVAAEFPLTGAVGTLIELADNALVHELQRTRRPVIVNDIATNPLAERSRATFAALGINALAVVPLISRDRVFGSISLDSYQGPLIWSDDELDLMMTVATSLAAAVENAQLFAAEQEQRRTAETLREIARVISASFDPDEVLRLVLGELHGLIRYDTASIMLLDGALLRLVATRGWSPATDPRGAVLPLAGSAAGEVVRLGQPLLYRDGHAEGVWAREDIGGAISCWLGVPLVARGRVLGVLNIGAYQPDAFGERDIGVAGTFANHAAVAIENARLYQESVTRVEQELEIARRIQANLFPRDLPALPGLMVAARCLPARETGGDFYDVLDLGTQIGVLIGDVSGKSLPAAMLMAVARSTARSEARNHETPWVVLTETNRWLVDDVPRHSFVALSYALVDAYNRRLVLSNAGQLAPLLRHANGQTSFLEAPPSLPIGLGGDTEYRQAEYTLTPGDTLVFYTDGIVEAHDQQRNLFSFERLERLVRRLGGLPPAELIAHILADVHAFSEGAPTHDDMTLVVVRVG